MSRFGNCKGSYEFFQNNPRYKIRLSKEVCKACISKYITEEFHKEKEEWMRCNGRSTWENEVARLSWNEETEKEWESHWCVYCPWSGELKDWPAEKINFPPNENCLYHLEHAVFEKEEVSPELEELNRTRK